MTRIMVVGLSLVARLAFAAEGEATLSYTLPESGTYTDADVGFTDFQPGERVCKTSDAEPLVIKAASPDRTRKGGMVNRTYTVTRADGKTEEVFGAELTPLCFRADLNGDGKDEPVTVGFDAEAQIRVRIGDSSVAFRAAGEAYLSRKGGNASARLQAAGVAGIPMLVVASRPDACAEYFENFVSAVGGRAQVALELVGVADPPAFSEPSVKFDPKRRTAVVTWAQLDEMGEKVVKRTRARFRLVDGVYVKK